MKKSFERNEMFKSSQMTILISYSLFGVILIGESLLMNWEKWAIFLIMAGLILAWFLHIGDLLTPDVRIWTYSLLMMATFFFYGIHQTSTFDLAGVMAVVIMIYIMTGMKSLIILCIFSYYITFLYGILSMIASGEVFDSLVVSRSLLHLFLVGLAGWVACVVIDKWHEVLKRSGEEITLLKSMTEGLNDFMANISHEIRTPVNAVVGLTEICIEKEDDEEIKKHLNSVYDAGRRVGEQISDILDYSEIDMDKLVNNTEDYMLSSLINDLVTGFSSSMGKGPELIIDVDASIPVVMNTDVNKLKKILWHLINNGLKYTKEGGVYVHITSEPREYGINLCIEVSDSGIGMDDYEMERILDSFFKSDSGRSRSTNGLGLGLAIVNGFVRSLGGFLTIESEPDKGTTVRISIPQKVVDEDVCMKLDHPDRIVIGAFLHFEKFPHPQVRDYYNAMVRDIVCGLKVKMHRVDNIEGLKRLSESVKFTHLFVGKEEYESDSVFMENLAKTTLIAIVADEDFELPEGSHARIMRKPFYCFPVINFLNTDPALYETETEGRLLCPGVKVLVVDDEPMNLTVAKGVFSRYEIEVATADSGKEAIDAVRINDYDIIFMDHMMPGMDGVEAMKRIRTELSKDKRDIPIVALTANAVSSAKEMFLREGFDGFVSKPIELTELERVIRKVLPASKIKGGEDGLKEILPLKKESDTGNETGKYAINAGSDTGNEAGTDESGLSGLEELGINIKNGLRYAGNDEEFYRSLLLQYAADAERKRQDALRFLSECDVENYAVVVHALKSTSKMIGADSLSEMAKELEAAAKNGDIATVNNGHAAAMEMYEKISAGLLKFLGAEESSEEEILEFAPEGGDDK
ncbi:MAG: response regulator [Lachnospiraceae bacterium]|nr:response regulator [Lachnospiraceae bacterium]